MAYEYTSSRVWITLLLGILVAWGGYLRFEDLSRQSYWMDEGFTINAVLSVERHGSTVLDSGRYYSCPLYCYPTATIAEFFGDNAFSYRLLAALAGTAFIPVFFLICARFFNIWVASAAAFFVTFSYFQIAWARQARWYTLFELFFWLALWTFYETLREKRRNKKMVWGIATLIFSLAAGYAHNLGWLLPGIFALWFVIDQQVSQRLFSTQKSRLLLLVTVATSILFTAFIYGYRTLHVQPFEIRLHNYLPYYTSFFITHYWLVIALTLPAIVLIGRTDRKPLYYLVLIFAAYLIPLAFMSNIIHYRYLFHVSPVLFAGAAIGVVSIAEQLASLWQRIFLTFVLAVLFIWSSAGLVSPQNFYYLESDNPQGVHRPYYAMTPQADWNNAYAYIASSRGKSDIIISSMPTFTKIFLGEPGYWLAYNYLGFADPSSAVIDGRETYVSAYAIESADELTLLLQSKHGFIVLDSMARSKRIDASVLSLIELSTHEVYHTSMGAYSDIWVYKF